MARQVSERLLQRLEFQGIDPEVLLEVISSSIELADPGVGVRCEGISVKEFANGGYWLQIERVAEREAREAKNERA